MTFYTFPPQAQDSTVGRIELLKLLAKTQNKGILSVGDSMQAINGWTGALPDAMATFRDAPNTNNTDSNGDGSVGGCYRDMPCTWRCPKLHVMIVNQMLEEFKMEYTFKASPKAKEGLYVEDGTFTGEFALIPTGDQAVLCRWNKPLFELRLELMRQGVPCWIVGHEDIASQMSRTLQTLSCSATISIATLIDRIEVKSKELLEAIAGHNDDDDDDDDDGGGSGGGSRRRNGSGVGGEGTVDVKEDLQNQNDNLDCLRATAHHVKEQDPAATSKAVHQSIQALMNQSERTADDGKPNAIRLSTFHRAKGAGFHRVYLLAYDAHIQRVEEAIGSNAKRWAVRQEIACAYVALTRSYSDLIILRSVGEGECSLLFAESAGGGGGEASSASSCGFRRRICVGPRWSKTATDAAKQLNVVLASPSTVVELGDPESQTRVQAKLLRAIKDAFNTAVRSNHPDKQGANGGSGSGSGARAGDTGSSSSSSGSGGSGGVGGGERSTAFDARPLQKLRDLLLNEIKSGAVFRSAE